MAEHRCSTEPDPRLRFDPDKLHLKAAPRSFFRRDTAMVAQDLVGAWFARRYRGKWHGARIVETEAYLGNCDAAAHTWRGRRTPRVEPMYKDGGHLYVFFVYGMHSCANIVTQPEGIGEAVLLRAAEGPPGVPSKLMSGPGRLCAALGITTWLSGADLVTKADLRLFMRQGPLPEILVSPRIGVDYAGAAKDWPLRFFAKNSSAVSRPARLEK